VVNFSRYVRFLGAALVGLGAVAQPALASTRAFEGTAVIAAGSINPPDPVEGCNRAKRDAEAKAAAAGTKRWISWDHLSVDSDCSLTPQGARGAGYYYIFTARGQFEE